MKTFAILLIFGLTIFLSLFKKGKKIDNLKKAYKDATIIFLLWIAPLLVIAGIIESLSLINYWF